MKRKLTKLLALLLACVLLSGCGASDMLAAASVLPLAAGVQTQAAGANGRHTIAKQTYTLYLRSLNSTYPEAYPLYFFDGHTDIPYVELHAFVDLLTALNRKFANDNGYKLTVKKNAKHVTLERENEFTLDLDFATNIMYYDDYDMFIQHSESETLIDLLTNHSVSEEGKELLFMRDESASFFRYGKIVTVDLGAYDIEMFTQDGKFYMPLQTMNDFLVAPLGVCLLFNGKALYAANDAALYNYSSGRYSKLGQSYYTVSPTQRSDALAEFSYNELCLMLDTFYGLKDPHDITSFMEMIWEIEYDEAMRGNDPGDADRALKSFIDLYLDDQHSSFTEFSWMTGKGSIAKSNGTSSRRAAEQRELFRSARAARYPNGCPGYEEVGDTAYITFDSFSAGATPEEYISGKKSGNLPNDTIGLIIQAHEKITRKKSPVKNVVLDMSNNRGGNVDAAVFVLSWLLGDASISVKDMATEGVSTSVYRADVNLDGKFDDSDTVKNLNLFCLISPVSFSCGSLLPAALKSAQRVTLIGQNTGGGSCVIRNCSTAYGSVFRISGQNRLSFMMNGSFYDTDQGMRPDFYLGKTSSFYDRKTLTKYIDSLM